jgi:hypothetical protein
MMPGGRDGVVERWGVCAMAAGVVSGVPVRLGIWWPSEIAAWMMVWAMGFRGVVEWR